MFTLYSHFQKSLQGRRKAAPGLVFYFLIAFTAAGASQPLSDATLASLQFEQKLNAQVSPDLIFRDESGRQVRLGEFLGRTPIIVVLGYYQCPMLCTLVLNGMVESLEDMKWTMGKEFAVINVSIDPQETPALAAAKKRAYLKRYGRAGAAQGWHFLTGDQPAIQQLAADVGFHYAYDQASRQYAHPSGLVVLTPEGKVAGYVFGVTYSPSEVFQLLQKASAGQISSPIQKLVLLCFHYNPLTGKYGPAIMVFLRVLGVVTVLGIAGLLLAMARRQKARLSDAAGEHNGLAQPEPLQALHSGSATPAEPKPGL